MAEVKSTFSVEGYKKTQDWINADKAVTTALAAGIIKNIIDARIFVYNIMMTYLFGCAVVQRTLEWIQAVLVPVGFTPEELENLTQFPGKGETATPAKLPAETPAETPRRTPAAETPGRTPAAATPRRTPAETPRRTPAAETPGRTPVDAPVVAHIPKELECIRNLEQYVKQDTPNIMEMKNILSSYQLTWNNLFEYIKIIYMGTIHKDENDYKEFKYHLALTFISTPATDYFVNIIFIPILRTFCVYVLNKINIPSTISNNMLTLAVNSAAYGMRLAEFNCRNIDGLYINNHVIFKRDVDDSSIKATFTDNCYIVGGILYSADRSRAITNETINNLVLSLYMANMHIFNSKNNLFKLVSPLALYDKIKNIDNLNNYNLENYKSIVEAIANIININITVRWFNQIAGENTGTYGNQTIPYKSGTISCVLFMLNNKKIAIFPHIMSKNDILTLVDFNGNTDFAVAAPTQLLRINIQDRIKIYKFLNEYKST